jgi:hypothetical protein
VTAGVAAARGTFDLISRAIAESIEITGTAACACSTDTCGTLQFRPSCPREHYSAVAPYCSTTASLSRLRSMSKRRSGADGGSP